MRMDDVEYNTSSSNAPWNTQFHFIPIIAYKFSENYGGEGEANGLLQLLQPKIHDSAS